MGFEFLALCTPKHWSCILHRLSGLPSPMTTCEWWSKEKKTILLFCSCLTDSLPGNPSSHLLLPSQFWWLFFCGLKVLAQNSVLSHLLFAQDFIFRETHSFLRLRLSPPAQGLDHHHLSPEVVISTWIPSNSVYKVRPHPFSLCTRPPVASVWFRQFCVYVEINFSWCENLKTSALSALLRSCLSSTP